MKLEVFCDCNTSATASATIAELYRTMKYFQISKPLVNELWMVMKENLGRLLENGEELGEAALKMKKNLGRLLENEEVEQAIRFFNMIFVSSDKTEAAELLLLMKTSDLERVIRQGHFTAIESFEAVFNLVKHHIVVVSNENVVLKASLSWVCKEPIIRVKYLDEIIEC